MMREQLLSMIQKEGILPPFPEIITRLREMIEDPDTGINDVARVIQSDPVLAGRLIHLANSVFGSSSVFFATELTRALSRLGLKMAMDLAYSLKVPNLFKEDTLIDHRLFWRHSLGLGIMSSKIAQSLGANSSEVSHAYLGGLMRQIGILLFSNLIPEEYGAFLKEVEESLKAEKETPNQTIGLINLESFEQNTFGLSSAELGAAFIEKWWELDPKVVHYVRTRPKSIEVIIEHAIEIARYVLSAEGVSDGVINVKSGISREYIQARFGFTESEYQDLTAELSTELNVFA